MSREDSDLKRFSQVFGSEADSRAADVNNPTAIPTTVRTMPAAALTEELKAFVLFPLALSRAEARRPPLARPEGS